MGLPKSSLTEDERIVFHFHPHWSTLVGEVLLILLTFAVAGAAIWFVPDGSLQTEVRLGIAGVAVIVALIWGFIPFLRWFFTSYILTNRRFVMRHGILSRAGRDIPLTRVNDVSFEHSLIERILRSGNLTVESAGERGQLHLKNVPKVEHVQAEMYRLIEELNDGDGIKP